MDWRAGRLIVATMSPSKQQDCPIQISHNALAAIYNRKILSKSKLLP